MTKTWRSGGALMALALAVGLTGLPSGGATAKRESGGTLTPATAPSAALGTPIDYTVYLPDGYTTERNAATRYPVLYLLHGRGDTMQAWTRIKADLDRLIADRVVPPVIAVLPDAPWSSRGSYYVDSAYTGDDPGRPVETALTRDLVTHVDGTYRTARAPERPADRRVLDGWRRGAAIRPGTSGPLGQRVGAQPGDLPAAAAGRLVGPRVRRVRLRGGALLRPGLRAAEYLGPAARPGPGTPRCGCTSRSVTTSGPTRSRRTPYTTWTTRPPRSTTRCAASTGWPPSSGCSTAGTTGTCGDRPSSTG